MTREDYCSYEVAKLLKEKGFEGDTHFSYSLFDKRKRNFFEEALIPEKDLLPCPTHQMAMKWLREKHKLFIDISFQKDEDGSVTWFYMTWALDDRKRDAEEVDFASYEEAVEAALKYTLKNLI